MSTRHLPDREKSRAVRPAAAIKGMLVAALCVLSAGCGMGSRRLQPGVYPFDPHLDCLFDDRHVILFLVDGLRADVLREMVRAGELPAIKKYLVDRGVSADCAVSTVPPVTNASVAALTCGAYPGRLNILGNRWFDRETSRRVSVLDLDDYYVTEEYLVAPTVYEMLGDELTVSLFTRCPRGSTYHIPVYYSLIGMKYYLARNWGKVDEAFLREYEDVAACASREGVFPRFVLFHLAGFDSVAHHTGSYSPQAREMLRNMDRALAPIMENLERSGALDRVCLVLTSDHGHVPIGRKNRLSWKRWFPARLGLPALGCSGDSDHKGEGRYDRFAVVDASNGRNSFLHFRHNPAGRWVRPEAMAAWGIRPSWEELRRYQTPGGLVDLVGELRKARGVSLVAGRPREGEIAIFSAAGEGRIRTEGAGGSARRGPGETGGEPRFAYEVVAGDDPLGYREAPEAAALMDGRFHGSRDWLRATCGLERPDVVAQLPSIFDAACSGDLYVVAADEWDFGRKDISGHGGLARGEMRIPLIIAGPRIRRGAFGPVRIVDIVPTVLDYVGHGDRVREYGMDGVSFLGEISAP